MVCEDDILNELLGAGETFVQTLKIVCVFLGGHINPTVTFSLCLLGREPWKKFPVYFLAQTIGGFLGSGIIFSMYFGKSEGSKNILYP